MATLKEFYGNGIENAIDGLMSRIANDYREGYGFATDKTRNVMGLTYAFLNMLQTAVRNKKETGRMPNMCIVYDFWRSFQRYRQKQNFKDIVEASRLGVTGIMTPHMVDTLDWIDQFCEELFKDMK